MAIDIHHSVINLKLISGQRNHTLDIALLVIMRIQKDHHVPAMNLTYPIRQLVHKQPILVLEHRQHARPFHPHRLIQKDDDERRHRNRDNQVPHPRMHTTPSHGRRLFYFTRRLRPAASLSRQLHLLLTHLDVPASFPSAAPATPFSPNPGTSTFPSNPVGDHASTISFAIFPIRTSPSLSAVQLLSWLSYVKIESTIGPVFPPTIATSFRTAFKLPVLLAIPDPVSLASNFSRYLGIVFL